MAQTKSGTALGRGA